MTDRRTEIVDAALGVIGEEGLGSFTQPRVARRAGLRQSHLTYYFPTRADLLVAVAHEVVRRRLDALQPVLAAATPGSKVAALAEVLLAPEQTRMLLALTQAADRDPDVGTALVELGRGQYPIGLSLLEAFGATVDPAALDALQSTSTGLAVLALGQGEHAFRGRAEAVLTALLRGLAATGPAA